MAALEGYASATSVSPGEDLDFHVRADPPHFYFQLDVYRKGRDEQLVFSSSGMALDYATPANASEVGCDWPVALTLTIPDDWSSGVYLARLTSSDASTDIPFVVKAAALGSNSKILFQLSVNTDQAYNNWGGKSLYGYNSTDDNGDGKGDPLQKVSFDRPGALTSDSNFYQFQFDFVAWLENNGFEVEYCTSVDLHAEPDFLNDYQLLLSVGHDEYWSKEMRDSVEAFVGNGGNVAFFSGNVCWWQVRFEDDNRTLVCFRNTADDPSTGVDDSRVTVNWRDDPVNRPENAMTGVSFVNGAGWWNGSAGTRPAVDYQVHFARHWVFDTTGLSDGDGFGADDLIVGYEADAALFQEDENGVPSVTGTDGTPLNFLVLASADCTDWQAGGYSGPDGMSGMATMGLFRNHGIVFTAGTTDWSHGLRGDWNAVSQITQNILRRLSVPCGASPHVANSGFEKWMDGSPEDWSLEGDGGVSADPAAAKNGHLGLRVDATVGQTWISQALDCEGRNFYRVGCWANCDRPGATIRLQSTTTWTDFAIAEHSGSGQWEYLSAVGMLDNVGPLFPARVKIQVAEGVIASFDDVTVDAL